MLFGHGGHITYDGKYGVVVLHFNWACYSPVRDMDTLIDNDVHRQVVGDE